jgi:ectoine hydroxylase-related dioxygenase (phytanoyl-CoA dioxygenase family)
VVDQFVDKRAYADVTASGQTLTESQVDEFNRDGYLVLRQVLDQSEVAPLRLAAERLFATTPGEWISAPEKQDPALRGYAFGRLVQGLIGELNGPSGILLGFLYRKQCTSPVPKQWHQDAAYWDMSDARVMALFTPVTPITMLNGAIHVIPGSHRLGRLFHRPAENYNLVCDTSAFREPHVVELMPGDVMAVHSFTLHCSPANPSPETRINFGLHFYNHQTRIVRDAASASIYDK